MKKTSHEYTNKEIEELSKKLSPIDKLIPPAKNISPSEITEKISKISRFKVKRHEFYMRAASLAVACLALIIGLKFSNYNLDNTVKTVDITSQISDFISEPQDSESTSTASENKTIDSQPESSNSKHEQTISKPEPTKPKIVDDKDYKDVINALKTIASHNNPSKVNHAIGSSSQATGSKANTQSEAPTSPTGGSDNSEHSTTNTQVQGVDEADILKNDGKYIYWLSFNEVKIISALPADNMEIVSTISLKEINDNSFIHSYEMFVYQDTLVVIGSSYGSLSHYSKESPSNSSMSNEKIYYAYNESVMVTVFDIKNKNNPKKVRTFKQDGYYISSRLIDKNLYLVTTAHAHTDLIEEGKPELIVPNTSDTNTTGKFAPLAAQNIIIAPNPSTPSYTVVSGLDITDTKKEANTKSYLGSGHYIYASTSNIYVASIAHNYNITQSWTNTNIIKFGISNGNVSVDSSGSVPGSIIGQFAMDEYDNHFRIATTTRSDSTQSMLNNVYVLDNNLNITGKVEGLAPGETIYAARFMGEKAYLVTYMTSDPLFVIDMKDHKNPKVLGQLEMPGFSNYLHPYSENLLIGFGKDSEEFEDNGFKFAKNKGLKIALYDVSDPLNPTEVSQLILGDTLSYSEVNENHKAFLFSKEKNIIGFPAIIYDKNYNYQFSGYYILSLDTNKDFEIKGKIQHPSIHYGSHMRGTYIGNILYTLSDDKIIAISLDNFEQIATLDLPAPDHNNSASSTYENSPAG